MGFYAQNSYTDKMGNGPFTIKQIGCFVTAFSNLLQEFGEATPPNSLNTYFTEHNVYLPDPADGNGVHDDLAFGSVTAFDKTITVHHTGTSGWPVLDMTMNTRAIVEFRYNHQGKEITHFCLVDSPDKHTIVDSWDGVVKAPGMYGEPVAWATYTKNIPQVVTVPHPSSQPVQISTPNYDGESITIQPGWGLSNAAATAGYTDANTETRWASIAQLNGSDNWKAYNAALQPGERIKVGSPVPVAASPSDRIVTVESGWGLERVAAMAGRTDAASLATWQLIALANGGKDWQTFNAHLQPGQKVKVPLQPGHGEGEVVTVDTYFNPSVVRLDTTAGGLYTSRTHVSVINLADRSQVKSLPARQPVSIVGSFHWRGMEYMLPAFAYTEKSWFAIPSADLVEPGGKLPKTTMYERFLKLVGGSMGLLKRSKKA